MARLKSIEAWIEINKSRSRFIDITPVVGMLLLVLIFMVQGQNHSGLVSTIADSIQLPLSTSQTANSTGVNVQVSTSQIWVDEFEVLNSNSMKTSKTFDKSGKRILPLYEHLIKLKVQIQKSEKLSKKVKPFSGVVNLVVDKSLKFSYLKRVMSTCADAGYGKFKFVVGLAQK